ncbi:MAG: ABC transporter permease, partial [Candidatus Lokiarchaeota archaeon]
MTMIKRAIRNIIRKKGLSLIIIVIMSLSMAILLSIPASINATQQQIEQVKEENNQYTQRQRELLNESASLIEVSSSNSGIGSAVGMGTSVAISDSSGDPDIKISTLFESPLINYSVADDIKNAIEGIEGILPLYEKDVGEFEKRDDEFLGREIEFWVSYYQAVGVPLNSSYANKLLSLEFLEGKNLEVGNEKQVIISSDLQEELDTDVGRYLDVNGTNFEIVGVFKSSFGTEKLAYMALSEAQNAFNIGNKISKINVYAK